MCRPTNTHHRWILAQAWKAVSLTDRECLLSRFVDVTVMLLTLLAMTTSRLLNCYPRCWFCWCTRASYQMCQCFKHTPYDIGLCLNILKKEIAKAQVGRVLHFENDVVCQMTVRTASKTSSTPYCQSKKTAFGPSCCHQVMQSQLEYLINEQAHNCHHCCATCTRLAVMELDSLYPVLWPQCGTFLWSDATMCYIHVQVTVCMSKY